ncbi:hypothetical protein PGT21_035463 [Puccinia graminis f. sp. tritici]|uniref:Uncharacterized protein n=1 Tax=Puccinia graminis f. sp. tritici TaxID=56615 RepID=A0A5B0N6B1_PUCGR|nr:hypothetical protein PGT21_035463 [Puccinia graminis f. sp. tritici]
MRCCWTGADFDSDQYQRDPQPTPASDFFHCLRSDIRCINDRTRRINWIFFYLANRARRLVRTGPRRGQRVAKLFSRVRSIWKAVNGNHASVVLSHQLSLNSELV